MAGQNQLLFLANSFQQATGFMNTKSTFEKYTSATRWDLEFFRKAATFFELNHELIHKLNIASPAINLYLFMNIIMKLTLYFISLALVISGCSVNKTTGSAFQIIQMTDTQFGFYSNDQSYQQETANYTRAIKAANKIKPDFVIVTGDLVNKPFDKAQIAEYKRISSMLENIPVHHVPGNHDVGNEPDRIAILKYRQEFGMDYYSIRHKTLYAIVLNSLYLHKPGNIQALAAAQEKWLEEELSKAHAAGYQHKIIFLHHPLFLTSAHEADGYFTIPTATREKYLRLFSAFNISHVFAGHYHQNAFGKYGNLEMVTSGPVGKPLGEGFSGYRVIRFSASGITHEFIPLDPPAE